MFCVSQKHLSAEQLLFYGHCPHSEKHSCIALTGVRIQAVFRTIAMVQADPLFQSELCPAPATDASQIRRNQKSMESQKGNGSLWKKSKAISYTEDFRFCSAVSLQIGDNEV